MRAYLIADGIDEPDLSSADAWVVDVRLAMTEGALGQRRVALLLRIAGIDLDGLPEPRPDAILLPASHGREIAHLGARLAVHEAEHGLADGSIGIVALIDSAAGVLGAGSFAGASPRLRGIGWDAVLATELGAQPVTAEGDWSPVLAQARAMVRLAAAAAGVEAIEAAYPGENSGKVIAAARRDGFTAMFARDALQARLIGAGP
ncbi:aldolase/citrate lyase family protein [Methylobacterium brachythecii]|uniref:Citrate lyase subunit beta/citryl-CoA lyase n=1 Tax=Methylobacterium brachythecii TaxID=1176177 RepID=A0A7W6AKT5_9HYPH|nr:aldolase/citrate lyase family protein [Methylobacterium brachythecii]MBB3903014.1 citrate lyase subunit beta/citryl-CoA lyase [Methylobacterium brachythecii]